MMRTNVLWSGLICTIPGGDLGQCRRKLRMYSSGHLSTYFGELCSNVVPLHWPGEVHSYGPKNCSYYAGL